MAIAREDVTELDNNKIRILIVDDEQSYCDVLNTILAGNGYLTESCNNGKQALELLEKSSFDIIISDLQMPVMDGYTLLKEIKKREYDSEVIMLTAFGTIEKAVEAMRAGAYTYVTKGTDPQDLLNEIKRISDKRLHEMELREKQNLMQGKFMLESRNEEYQQMLLLAERAAGSESNILVLGESGSGKEILSSFIHNKSARSKKNFLELNCQSLSDSILESELFGHEKGSFTGAINQRIGHFEAANGGTLFLDEIGGISVNLQAKMLKAIENKIIYRMGSSTPINVDFRLITATNRNLKEDMDEGLFRSDLFYRISTIVLTIPPLRNRKEDIPLFIDYFVDLYSAQMGISDVKLDGNVRGFLEEYDYPGNVRELKNVIERLLVLSEDGLIKEEFLPLEIREGKKIEPSSGVIKTDYTESLRDYRCKAEKAYISQLLNRYPTDMNKVAEILSISRRQLFNKLVEYDLK